jgi:hypothetical protein
MENCENSYIQVIDEKIELGRSLIDKLEHDFIKIEGALKTKRNIEKEIKFLQKVSPFNCLLRLYDFLTFLILF